MVQHAQLSVQQEPGLFCVKEYYTHIMPAHRTWGNFSISFWSIPWDENSVYHRHTYFEYNHLVTKQLAAAYKTQKSWEWEVLFLLLVSVENYTSAGWNAVYYHPGWSSTSPAVCNFTGWWAQRETPPHTCLAVLSCWPGGCWLSPAVAGTTLDGTRTSGPVLHVSVVRMPINTAESGWSQCWAGHWAVLSKLGGCPVKASLGGWRSIGKGLKRSGFFPIRNYLPTRPWAKSAAAPSCQWEFCTSALKAAQTSCTYSENAARSCCLLERLLCVPVLPAMKK